MKSRKHTLLQQAVLLDSETTGLARGSGIHELAVLDLETQKLYEYILRPNYVEAAGDTAQDLTRLASSSMDIHRGRYPGSWMDVVRAQLVMDRVIEKSATQREIRRTLEWHNPFLSRMLKSGAYPHLEGKLESGLELQERAKTMKRFGAVKEIVSNKDQDIKSVLQAGGDLEKLLKGKTVWLANAMFEAKQIGAQIGALEGQGIDVALKRQMETYSDSPDPFYVTGREVNEARVKAQLSGDWTKVWKAYIANPPQAGETAVRDIQDVLRAFKSYGKKLGLVGAGVDPYLGTSMEFSFRLFGSLEEDPEVAKQFLRYGEAHRAAEDVAIHEQYVLKKSIEYTSALQEVSERTPLGLEYERLAASGRGPLAAVRKYFAREEYLQPVLQEVAATQRLGRAQADILAQGTAYQAAGFRDIVRMTQQTPGGYEEKVPRLAYDRVGLTSLEEVAAFMKQDGRYGEVNLDTLIDEIRSRTAGVGTTVARQQGLSEYLEEKTRSRVADKISAEADILMKIDGRNLSQEVTRYTPAGRAASGVIDAMSQMKSSSLIRGWGALAAGLTLAGGSWSMMAGNAKATRDAPSLVTYNYQEWLRAQEQFSGQRAGDEQMQGMHDSGLAGHSRRLRTDFGSPYQGMMGSEWVFHDQELLRERERWIREQYGAVHYDPEFGLHGLAGPFKAIRNALPRGYHYIPEGRSVSSGRYSGLQGNNLMEINLSDSNWKMNVEDADTVVLQRGGIRGAIQSLFGMNRKYSFRLAGIDAPELSHGPTSYHAPQPNAENAKAAVRSMIAGTKNLTLVYDPKQTTYGRMMGAVIADGKNINFEAVRRGHAAHLPYGKASDSMIDYRALAQIEGQAAGAGRGVWAYPYYQAFRDVTEAGGERPTFNTLTSKSKVAANVSYMNMIGLMEQAEAQGMYSNAQAIQAQRIGKVYHSGVDNIQPALFDQKQAHYNAYMSEMQQDVGRWTRTAGSDRQNRFSHRSGFGKLNSYMALDSMDSTNSVWNRRRLKSFERYGSDNRLARTRKARMAEAQRDANKYIFSSPIHHGEM